MTRIAFGRLIPTERKIGRSEFFLGECKRVEKLIIQFGNALTLRFIRARDIQRMVIPAAAFKILRPRQPVFGHPPEALEHTLGKDHLHVVYVVLFAPYILDYRHSKLGKQPPDVDFMDYPLDIRQSDLKRVVCAGWIERVRHFF